MLCNFARNKELSPPPGQAGCQQTLLQCYCCYLDSSLKMETEADWLASVNRQLTRTIIDLQLRLKIESEHKEQRSLKQLFSMGCGFTGVFSTFKPNTRNFFPEFLREVFNNLSLKEVQHCRLVCSEWKHFIDQCSGLEVFFKFC